jgi:Protein of unknown function (DUF2809)
MMLKFNKLYFFVTVLLFGIEVLIAVFVHDNFVRPYVGDTLVVILIYCFVRSFLDTPVLKTALCVLLFAYLIEVAQYFHIVNRLGLQKSKIASVVIGTSFEPIDLIAYTIGFAFILYAEKVIARRKQSN